MSLTWLDRAKPQTEWKRTDQDTLLARPGQTEKRHVPSLLGHGNKTGSMLSVVMKQMSKGALNPTGKICNAPNSLSPSS